MINLIPPEGHRALKREYRLRVGATLALLFAGVALLLAAALIPTYILVGAQINAFAIEGEEEGDKEDALTDITNELELTKELLTQLKVPQTGVPTSFIIEEIQNKIPEGVTFDTYYTAPGPDGFERVHVQGTATTREALARFKQELESSPMFETAEVPISDLARETNLTFTVTITLTQKK